MGKSTTNDHRNWWILQPATFFRKPEGRWVCCTTSVVQICGNPELDEFKQIYIGLLVGGLEHFFIFQYIGNNNPN